MQYRAKILRQRAFRDRNLLDKLQLQKQAETALRKWGSFYIMHQYWNVGAGPDVLNPLHCKCRLLSADDVAWHFISILSGGAYLPFTCPSPLGQ